MSNEPKINTHTYQDPFEGKEMKILYKEDGETVSTETITLSSRKEFSTLLEEVKQYNNDPTNIKEHRVKNISM